MVDKKLDHSMFIYHTHGSHHVWLVNACVKLWNTLVEAQKNGKCSPANLRPLPELRPANSGEKFGLVRMSVETATQYSLTTIKQEPGDDDLNLLLQDVLDPDCILKEIGVDPTLINTPLPDPAPERAPVVDAKSKGVCVLLLLNYTKS